VSTVPSVRAFLSLIIKLIARSPKLASARGRKQRGSHATIEILLCRFNKPNLRQGNPRFRHHFGEFAPSSAYALLALDRQTEAFFLSQRVPVWDGHCLLPNFGWRHSAETSDFVI
jgi:hypothetical protein